MNRALTWINLVGVLVLAGLCVFQWRANRGLNLQVNDLEATRFAQAAQIDEQTKKLGGLTADLERFREQLGSTSLSLKDTKEKLRASEHLAAQLASERDQLKDAIACWTAAVASRDRRLTEANTRISDLGAQLHDAVTKYNALVATHNTLVQQINDARKQVDGDGDHHNTP